MSPTNQLMLVATTTSPNSEGFHSIVSYYHHPTSNKPTVPGGITPAQLSTFIQFLAQTLHQNSPTVLQQLSIPNTFLLLTSINLPRDFSVAQYGSATTQPIVLTSTISHALHYVHRGPIMMHYPLFQIVCHKQLSILG